MSNLFGNRSLSSLVSQVVESLGGRGTHDEIVEAVKHNMTVAEHEVWSDGALRTDVIRAAKRKHRDPLEDVYSIGGVELAQLQHFSLEEFTLKAKEVASGAAADKATIYHLAKVCKDVHGESFDADAICAEAGIGAS